MRPLAEARELSERFGILVLRGMEVTTDIGHVLAFGLESYSRDFRSITALRRAVDAVAGAIFMAHPYRGWHSPIDWDGLPELVHGVEALNGQEHGARNDRALELATGFSVPGIGGSDTHFLPGLAVCATRLHQRPADESALAAELLRGRHEAVQLRVPGWSRKEIPPY